MLQAARQQLIRDWWDFRRQQHDLFMSQIVLDEIGGGEAAMARQRLALLVGVQVVRATDDVENLTQRILNSGLLPRHAGPDAAHIALATVYEMDILLSWNCRHIANAAIQARLRRLAEAAGFTLPVICTPEELMDNNYGQDD
jgi:hypothetical protein